MAPPDTQLNEGRDEKDEEWEYNVDDPIPLEDIENDSLEDSPSSASTFLPFIEFDREEGTVNFSRRQR